MGNFIIFDMLKYFFVIMKYGVDKMVYFVIDFNFSEYMGQFVLFGFVVILKFQLQIVEYEVEEYKVWVVCGLVDEVILWMKISISLIVLIVGDWDNWFILF